MHQSYDTPVERTSSYVPFSLNSAELDYYPEGTMIRIWIDSKNDLYIGSNLVGDVSHAPVLLLHACAAAGKHNAALPDTMTCEAARKIAPDIKSVYPGTVRKIFLKAMTYSDPVRFIEWLEELSLLEHICPALYETTWCYERDNETTTFIHSLLVLGAMVEMTKDPVLRLAALLHDIGKPLTWEMDYNKDGLSTFHRHEVEGAAKAQMWMKRFEFEEADIHRVTSLIYRHMWYFSGNTKTKTYRKWLRKTGPQGWRDLILLRVADRKGNPAKWERPVITHAMKRTLKMIWHIIRDEAPVFKEEINVTEDYMKSIGFDSPELINRAWEDIFGMLIVNPKKNEEKLLKRYLRKLSYRKQ